MPGGSFCSCGWLSARSPSAGRSSNRSVGRRAAEATVRRTPDELSAGLSLSLATVGCYPRLLDALTLEEEALKLTPLSRIRLADLLYTSLEVEADRERNRKAIAECESRYEAHKNGEMGSVDALEAIETLRTKFVK